jgi:hypothetical protein
MMSDLHKSLLAVLQIAFSIADRYGKGQTPILYESELCDLCVAIAELPGVDGSMALEEFKAEQIEFMS